MESSTNYVGAVSGLKLRRMHAEWATNHKCGMSCQIDAQCRRALTEAGVSGPGLRLGQ